MGRKRRVKWTEYPHIRHALVIDDYSVFYHHSDEQITVRNQDPKYLNEPMAPYGEQTDPTNVKD